MEGNDAAECRHTSEGHTVAFGWGELRHALDAVAATLDFVPVGERPEQAMHAWLITIATVRSRFDDLARDPSIREAGCGRIVEALRGAFDRVDGAVDEFLQTPTAASLGRLRTRVRELLDGVGELHALLVP